MAASQDTSRIDDLVIRDALEVKQHTLVVYPSGRRVTFPVYADDVATNIIFGVPPELEDIAIAIVRSGYEVKS